MIESPASLPPLPQGGIGAFVDRVTLDDDTLWSVGWRDGISAARRRWFPSRSLAIRYAANLADEHGLSMAANKLAV